VDQVLEVAQFQKSIFKGESLHTLDFFSWLASIEDNPSFSYLKGERERQIGRKV
jgi:hypothetical protein